MRGYVFIFFHCLSLDHTGEIRTSTSANAGHTHTHAQNQSSTNQDVRMPRICACACAYLTSVKLDFQMCYLLRAHFPFFFLKINSHKPTSREIYFC